MRYEKSKVEVVSFGKEVSFMASSNNEAAKQLAISTASNMALEIYGGGNSQVLNSNATYQPGGYWIVEVTVANHGGQHRKMYRYDESTNTCVEI